MRSSSTQAVSLHHHRQAASVRQFKHLHSTLCCLLQRQRWRICMPIFCSTRLGRNTGPNPLIFAFRTDKTDYRMCHHRFWEAPRTLSDGLRLPGQDSRNLLYTTGVGYYHCSCYHAMLSYTIQYKPSRSLKILGVSTRQLNQRSTEPGNMPSDIASTFLLDHTTQRHRSPWKQTTWLPWYVLFNNLGVLRNLIVRCDVAFVI